MTLTLYHYWRSSSSWRVRWALAHKKLNCDFVAINLLANEQNSAEHKKRNPAGQIPVLEVATKNGPVFLSESTAILEWLEETYPQNPLLPSDPFARAKVRELVQIVNSGIQPIQNMKVLNAVAGDDQNAKHDWSQRWIKSGFAAYEEICQPVAGKYAFGDSITLADLFLVPQLYNAARFNVDMTPYPTIARVGEAAKQTPDCVATAPDKFEPKTS